MEVIRNLQLSDKKIVDYLDSGNYKKVLITCDHGLGDAIMVCPLIDQLLDKYKEVEIFLGYHFLRGFDCLHKNTYPIKHFNEKYDENNFNFQVLGQYEYYDFDKISEDGFDIVFQLIVPRTDYLKYQIEASQKYYFKNNNVIDNHRFFEKESLYKAIEFENRKVNVNDDKLFFTKQELCSYLEFGLEVPVLNDWIIPVKLNNKDSKMVGIHWHSNSSKTYRGINDSLIKLLWDELVKNGYEPFEINMNFSCIRKEHIDLNLPEWLPKDRTLRHEKDNLKLLIEKISECKYFIGADSGPMHIASRLLGVENCVILKSLTDPKLHFPEGIQYVNITFNNILESLVKLKIIDKVVYDNMFKELFINQSSTQIMGDVSNIEINTWNKMYDNIVDKLKNKKSFFFGPFLGTLNNELKYFTNFVRWCKINLKDVDIKISCRKDRKDLYSDLFDEKDVFTFELNHDYEFIVPFNNSIYDRGKISSSDIINVKNSILNDSRIHFKGIDNFTTSYNDTYVNILPPSKDYSYISFNPHKDNEDIVDKFLQNNNYKYIIGLNLKNRIDDIDGNWDEKNIKMFLDNFTKLKDTLIVMLGSYPSIYLYEGCRDNIIYANDIYNMNSMNDNISLIGINMEFMKKCNFIFSIQSGITTLSNYMGIDNIYIGNKKEIYVNSFNFNDTNCLCLFHNLEGSIYRVDGNNIFNNRIKNILTKIGVY